MLLFGSPLMVREIMDIMIDSEFRRDIESY